MSLKNIGDSSSEKRWKNPKNVNLEISDFEVAADGTPKVDYIIYLHSTIGIYNVDWKKIQIFH